MSEEKPNIKIDDLDVNMHVDKQVNVFEQKTRELPINHRYVVKNNKPIGVRSYPGYYDPYDHSITNVVYPDPLYPYSHSYNYNRFLQHKYLDENRKLHNKLDILEDKIKHHHNHHNHHNHHKPHTVNNYYNSPKELIKQTKQTSKAPIAKSSELSSEVILKIPSEQPSKIMNESLPETSTEPSVETPVEEESPEEESPVEEPLVEEEPVETEVTVETEEPVEIEEATETTETLAEEPDVQPVSEGYRSTERVRACFDKNSFPLF